MEKKHYHPIVPKNRPKSVRRSLKIQISLPLGKLFDRYSVFGGSVPDNSKRIVMSVPG